MKNPVQKTQAHAFVSVNCNHTVGSVTGFIWLKKVLLAVYCCGSCMSTMPALESCQLHLHVLM
jgi:hypothetical protein